MNQPHPDDDLLNAALDGEPDADTLAHLGACDACLARLDALDGVRQQVAAVPAAAPPGVAERAVTAAAAAWRDERRSAAAPAPGPAPAPAAPVTPAAARGAHRADDDIVPLRRRPSAPAASRTTPRRRVPGWAFGAAAAVVAALLAVPFLLDGDDAAQQTASAPADEAAGTDAGALDGGELGSLSDNATLRDELLAAVPGAATAAAAESRTDQSAPSAGDSLAAPAREAPSPSTFAAGTTAAPAGAYDAAGKAAGEVPCREEIRAQLGDRLGPLLYTASLRWQGTEAVVLAYRLADTSAPGADHLAFVMARDDCRVLTSQGF